MNTPTKPIAICALSCDIRRRRRENRILCTVYYYLIELSGESLADGLFVFESNYETHVCDKFGAISQFVDLLNNLDKEYHMYYVVASSGFFFSTIDPYLYQANMQNGILHYHKTDTEKLRRYFTDFISFLGGAGKIFQFTSNEKDNVRNMCFCFIKLAVEKKLLDEKQCKVFEKGLHNNQ